MGLVWGYVLIYIDGWKLYWLLKILDNFCGGLGVRMDFMDRKEFI